VEEEKKIQEECNISRLSLNDKFNSLNNIKSRLAKDRVYYDELHKPHIINKLKKKLDEETGADKFYNVSNYIRPSSVEPVPHTRKPRTCSPQVKEKPTINPISNLIMKSKYPDTSFIERNTKMQVKSMINKFQLKKKAVDDELVQIVNFTTKPPRKLKWNPERLPFKRALSSSTFKNSF